VTGSAGNAEPLEIETTRPELIPACVALVAHPDDGRYAGVVGREAVTPLFGVRVPIRSHPLADPAKGTGLAMVCTFGDLTDVTWWRELNLPVRAVIQQDGTLGQVSWGAPGWESVDVEKATAYYNPLVGLSASKARAVVVDGLRGLGDLIGEPRPITHAVKFYEKGDRPLEIVTSRQWFVKTLAVREKAIAEHPREVDVAKDWCAGEGTIVLASADQVAAFEAAAKPVMNQLEQYSFNAEQITAIEQLKRSSLSSPGADICKP
jgi:valyl-tRNA synthetase